VDEALTRATDALIQAFGRQSAFWGLGRTAGEMYAVLYLSDRPLPLEELALRLRVTKGNISIAIRPLEQLGMVRRSWQPGDRRVFFAAEPDFWKIAHAVLAQRQKPEFDQTFALVEQSARLAREAPPSPERETVLARLAALQELYALLDSLVAAALALAPEQLRSLVELFNTVIGETDRGNA
jgi:DNA-binding transcriptional regulator GbsR (MarR family)